MNVMKYLVMIPCIVPVFLCPSVMAGGVQAGTASYSVTEGKQYIALGQKVDDVPEVLEFFSFYCRHCYQFEREFHLSERVQNKLPAGLNVVKYHVSGMGPLGKDLTRAWAVAMLLGAEDKIAPAMFDAIQKKHAVLTTQDIRRVFTDTGIRGDDYDSAWKSFAVNSLVARQEKAMGDFQVKGVPVMYVGGRYQINTRGMDADSLDIFTSRYAETVSQLVGRN